MSESYTQGGASPPLLTQTIGERLDDTVAAWPDRDALIVRHQGIRYTWAAFNAQVDRYARAFMALGLDKGDRVGMWGPNSAQWCITQFATAKAGLVMVNINPAYRTHELRYALKQSGCTWVICAEQFKSSNYEDMLRAVVPELDNVEAGQVHNTELAELRGVVTLAEHAPAPGFMTWAQLGERAEQTSPDALAERRAQLRCKDPINIQYTSGTTGAPKGATLSHHNILNNGYMVAESMGFTEQDRLVIPVPLYHCFGMVMGNLGCVTHGAAMIYPSAGFDPEAALRAAAEEKATAMYGVPTMFLAELEVLKHQCFDLSHLRTGIMAGSLCPVEAMRQVIDKMNMKGVQIAYGQTETSPVTTQTGPNDDIEHRTTSVGVAQPHMESKIIDAEGNTAPRGTVGEYCTRGYAVMVGYWENPAATAKAIDADGWMHSGDLGVMATDGYITIVGRNKDMIIRGGENIYPIEIENFLYTHPAVADVQVFGIPDEKFGEEVVAWVKLHPDQQADEDTLRAFCKTRIAHFKVPRHFKFVEEFPTTVTGKIQKFKMREVAVAERKAS